MVLNFFIKSLIIIFMRMNSFFHFKISYWINLNYNGWKNRQEEVDCEGRLNFGFAVKNLENPTLFFPRAINHVKSLGYPQWRQHQHYNLDLAPPLELASLVALYYYYSCCCCISFSLIIITRIIVIIAII